MLSWEHSPNLIPMLRERAWVEVDLGALAHNVQQIRRRLAPRTELMAVVKADAYGHGAVTIARTALRHGATWLGVATIPEGIELREAGIQAPILLLGATNTAEQVRAIAQWKLQPTLCTPKQALIFSETMGTMRSRSPLPVHLKLDTGMSRLGISWEQAAEFGQLVKSLPHLEIASVYSHLATADDPNPGIMQLQYQRYESAIAHLKAAGITPPRLHLANSAATLADPSLHYDLVRTGLAMYGLHPAPHLVAKIPLKPVLQVKARITQVKPLAAGTGVSYGHKFIADRDMQMAVIGIGYADGVPRLLTNRMEVLIRGQRVPQIGAVTMDQLMLDVSAIPDVQAGDVVTLLGRDGQESISADDWANTLGTISWEILCGFKHRLPRLTVNHPQEVVETASQN
ncbi:MULTISPECIES: alanine racemase [unclassified Leptolyngbya]|uniref:alanine racemase n=1 Tax=unclassified Leptolyngbya TaxID=2650499 RepID=UPI001686ADDF|nr:MULTISPECIES: alanine racemase [unclassified Leptolyngbya]MBD1912795.1 alanine racemase [Leptolyngbya sp. FACHB-8]MBD2157742.1 alanine racemase [Leptolyngbya sp. FACHB-16]